MTATSANSVRRIRRQLPNSVPERQKRLLVCAVRNPDADPSEISIKAIGDECASEVLRALRNLARGYYDENDKQDYSWKADRGHRMAQSFDELAPKQKAVVDFAARHYSDVIKGDMSNATVAEAMQNDTRLAKRDDMNPVMSAGQVWNTKDRYGELIADRRLSLVMNGEIDEQDELAAFESEYADKDVRELLELAGWDDLPESNLDDMSDLGFERASDLESSDDRSEHDTTMSTSDTNDTNETSDPYDGEIPRHAERVDCPDCSRSFDSILDAGNHECFDHTVVADWGDVDRLENGVDDYDVPFDTPFKANVNNADPHYGVFVSLNDEIDGPRSDVSGLLPNEYQFHDNLHDGDLIAVELVNRSKGDGGKTRMKFREVVVRSDVEAELKAAFDDVESAGQDDEDDEPEPDESDAESDSSADESSGSDDGKTVAVPGADAEQGELSDDFESFASGDPVGGMLDTADLPGADDAATADGGETPETADDVDVPADMIGDSGGPIEVNFAGETVEIEPISMDEVADAGDMWSAVMARVWSALGDKNDGTHAESMARAEADVDDEPDAWERNAQIRRTIEEIRERESVGESAALKIDRRGVLSVRVDFDDDDGTPEELELARDAIRKFADRHEFSARYVTNTSEADFVDMQFETNADGGAA